MQRSMKLFFMLFMTIASFSAMASFEEDFKIDVNCFGYHDLDSKMLNNATEYVKLFYTNVKQHFKHEDKTVEIKKSNLKEEKLVEKDTEKKKPELPEIETKNIELLKERVVEKKEILAKMNKASESSTIKKSESAGVDNKDSVRSYFTGKNVGIGGAAMCVLIYIIYSRR